MADLLLSFRDVSIRNFNNIVFEHLDFDLIKGRHWAVIGNSGSGKSTFLDAVAGKAAISGGTVSFPCLDDYLRENPVGDSLFNRFRLISYVSSRHNFRNHSNTSDFYYQQRFNSMDSEDSDTVEQYLLTISSDRKEGHWNIRNVTERLQLQSLLDKELIKLSNGETKRLRLAAALIKNPLILLLDNPLTGLDSATRKEFDGLLADIASSGVTIVMATSPDEIPDIITDIAFLEAGKKCRKISKSAFNVKDLQCMQYPQIDVRELDSLLSVQQMAEYKFILRMEDVSIKYGDKTILDHVSWEVKQGDHWALTGANGAGKSTLLSLINGDNPQAFANDIVLFDKPKGSGESIWDIKKRIGFVSPELFQYFPMDNVCMQVIESGFYDTLGLFRKPSASKSALCLRWMALLGIERYATTLFKNVPVSIQRLCLLARALVKNPPLLIFDEPCQGLDNEQQNRFKYLVDEICRRGKVTLIYVSHYEHEYPECIDHILHLKDGKVLRGD